MNRITRTLNLPSNDKGRDFIIGDLHGCYLHLLNRLDEVNFDKTIDRLFSVGDLCDRGPESVKCIQLLNEPWFHASLGNHDYMLCTFAINLRSSYHRSMDFIGNGGDWAFKLTNEELDTLAELVLAKMPLVIQTTDFTVTHARLQPYPVEKLDPSAVVWDREFGYFLQSDKVPESFKTEFGNFYQLSPYKGKMVYVGHNIVRNNHNVFLNDHLMIDTGAFLHHRDPKVNAGLTIIEHKDFIKCLK